MVRFENEASRTARPCDPQSPAHEVNLWKSQVCNHGLGTPAKKITLNRAKNLSHFSKPETLWRNFQWSAEPALFKPALFASFLAATLLEATLKVYSVTG
jgi:hypothetical protein